MLRAFVVTICLSCFTVSASAQTQAAPANTAPSAPAKPAPKKASPKSKVAAKPPTIAENGPCRIGVISAVGDRIAVQKFGVTVFETEEAEVPVDWGFDNLIVERLRAQIGTDPAVRRIAYPKGAFEPYYHPTSRFLPDPREGLPAIVQGITPNAGCERYLVVTRFKGQLAGTNIMLDGIGTYNQGLGTIIRHSHLFANISITLLDGRTYERINRPFANFGARLANSFRLVEDDLTRLDNASFPEPAAAAASSAVLRERLRTLIAAKMDQALPAYLKGE